MTRTSLVTNFATSQRNSEWNSQLRFEVHDFIDKYRIKLPSSLWTSGISNEPRKLFVKSFVKRTVNFFIYWINVLAVVIVVVYVSCLLCLKTDILNLSYNIRRKNSDLRFDWLIVSPFSLNMDSIRKLPWQQWTQWHFCFCFEKKVAAKFPEISGEEIQKLAKQAVNKYTVKTTWMNVWKSWAENKGLNDDIVK